VITGLHAVIFSERADEVRAFLRDVLELEHVDAGGGWLIFAAPPTELATHPAEQGGQHALYLMCDDVEATSEELRAKGVEVGPIEDQGFGLMTAIRLPDGEELGLYEPRHPQPSR
jgi:catechol 2,3-dioxygenase-like lactoylglutathione lyase family enzyme